MTLFMMVFFPKAQQLPFVSWEAFDTLILSQPRNTLVFVRTDWCSVCKKQIKDLEQAPTLLRLLSERVYLLDLNAEKEKRSLSFFGKIYRYYASGSTSGLHELAYYFSPRSQVYPLWVLLDKDGNILTTYEGYWSKEQLSELVASY
ncbi:thioredoxin family protein [Riemerella anatipestifer]|nr:redoxin domain-containing protein [Riemerella anatipestifer]MDD1524678.1 thioredoxin family protein [Riemerella anatipestifer]MRM92963.1 thioredoxin family protein [Riemerella anatipestifer]MRN03981.1 thioredoxin family protein [Riemerella anatipestifer]MSN89587.1 thioredoxin family protein [Riemerella anatipestifer]